MTYPRTSLRLLAATALLVAVGSAAGLGGEEPALRVHLPREVKVTAEALTLGALCVIRGQDAALVAKAEGVQMGRAPWRNEQILIDRPTIQGRLAAMGIGAGQVQLTGAQAVAAIRAEKPVAAEKLLAAAEALLHKDKPAPDGCKWRVDRSARELYVPAVDNIDLKAEPAEDSVVGCVTIRVKALVGTRLLGSTEVVFRLTYACKEVVARKDIAAGDVITVENIEVRTVYRDQPGGEQFVPPYGQVASQAIRAGSLIREAQLARPVEEIVVKRGQTLLMRIRGEGFVVSALGQALQDGRTGEFIKVRNITTSRIVTAKVGPDGIVQPVF